MQLQFVTGLFDDDEIFIREKHEVDDDKHHQQL